MQINKHYIIQKVKQAYILHVVSYRFEYSTRTTKTRFLFKYFKQLIALSSKRVLLLTNAPVRIFCTLMLNTIFITDIVRRFRPNNKNY